jgi:hypothetical protein
MRRPVEPALRNDLEADSGGEASCCTGDARRRRQSPRQRAFMNGQQAMPVVPPHVVESIAQRAAELAARASG